MTVYEFCSLCISEYEEMKLYSVDDETEVFSGTFDEAMYSEFVEDEVQSFEVENGEIVVNI